MPRYCLGLIALLLMSATADAKMYKWVDDEGNVHYSQTKPDADTEVQTIKPPPKVTPPPKPNRSAKLNRNPKSGRRAPMKIRLSKRKMPRLKSKTLRLRNRTVPLQGNVWMP